MLESKSALKQQALQKELADVKSKYTLATVLGTRDGFFKTYFDELPSSRTKHEAFNKVNDQYFDIYGEYKYQSFDSFIKQIYRHLKKKK